jgi:hypothetical protein
MGWDCLIVGIFVAKFAMATAAYYGIFLLLGLLLLLW